MFAYEYPLMGAFLSFLYITLMVIWIIIAVQVFIDIFRSHDLSGFAKALWVIGVIIFPYLGVFIYLVVRGGSMHERRAKEAAQTQEAFRQYVQETAGTTDTAGQLEKLAALRDQGVLTPEEFAAQKAKLLG
jgi:E3 ubiquitin-protein ligase DOA10